MKRYPVIWKIPAALVIALSACSDGSTHQIAPTFAQPGQLPATTQPGQLPAATQPGQPTAPGTPTVGGSEMASATPGATPAMMEGSNGTLPGAGIQPTACATQGAAASPTRRLSHREYTNTLRDLLNLDPSFTVDLPRDSTEHGFDNNAYLLTVGQLLADGYSATAEALATQAVTDLANLLPCATAADDACAAEFIADFGKRTFRRPLETVEIAALTEVFTVGKATSFEEGIRLVLTALMSSPSFLYRLELGGETGTAGAVDLTPYELATRISYTFTGSMPDAELFAAADNGQLSTREQVTAQAQRLIASPAGRRQIGEFYSQWFSVPQLANTSKDTELFTPQLMQSMVEETRRFVEHVFFEDDARLETLLTASYSFINAELAALYGANMPAGADGFAQVELPAQQRAGVLTHPSLLAVTSLANQSDPVRRGVFVREQLLCQTLPDTPADLVIAPPEVEPGTSTRERFRIHQENPACSGCHELLDDIGLGFEHFDELGRWRDTDQGIPVDATGRLVATLDIDGAFDGVGELAAKLSQSAEVRACAARQWFRFTNGRDIGEADQCAIAQLDAQFTGPDGNFRSLVSGITQTDTFFQKRVRQ